MRQKCSIEKTRSEGRMVWTLLHFSSFLCTLLSKAVGITFFRIKIVGVYYFHIHIAIVLAKHNAISVDVSDYLQVYFHVFSDVF